MKKTSLPYWITLFLTLFLIKPTQISAQKEPISFGEIELNDVSFKTYDKDPNAEAVILCDYGNTNFEYLTDNFKKIMKRHTRIKILKTSGINLGTVEIYYYSDKTDKEKIIGLKGASYNVKDGIIIKTKLEKEAIFDTKVNDDLRLIKFSLPNVKEGTVIEYSYSIMSPFSLRPWQFQDEIPIVWSEYRLSIPEYFNYVQIAQGYRPFDINERGKKQNSIHYTQKEREGGNSIYSGPSRTTYTDGKHDYQDGSYRWVMKDVPAFKNEKFITTPQDYVSKIDFQLSSVNYPGQGFQNILGTWENLKKSLYESESFGGFLSKKGAVKTLTATLITGKTDLKERMNIIYDYVRNNIQYDEGIDLIYPKQTPKQLLETKKGSSAEINLLLVMMLKEADIISFPILSSTRRHGKVNTNYPLISKFNYITAYAKIDKEEHVLDGTDPMRPIDMINSFALNGYGLIVDKEKEPLWISTQNVTKTSDIIIGTFKIEEEGIIKGDIITQHKGYAALRIRRKLINKEKTDEKTTTESDEDNKEIKDNTYKFIKDFEKPLEGQSKYQTSDYAQLNGDFIYISPMLKYQEKENPFKQEERLFPVDFSFPWEENFYLTYTIPDNYKVEEIPKSMRLHWEDKSVKFEFLCQVFDNKIQVVSKLLLGKAVFEPAEYKHLRDMYANIVAKHAEQIVLKKK